MSLQDYGSYSLYKTIFGFLIPVVGISFSNAVIRKYYSIDKSEFNSYILSLIVTMTLATGFFYILILLTLNFWLGIFKIDDPSIITYSLFVAYFTSVSAVILSYYRVNSKTNSYLISNLIIVIVTIVGVLLLKYSDELDLDNLLKLHLLAITISVVYNSFTFFRNGGRVHFSTIYLKDTFKYCLPLVVYSILAQIYASGDRFFINYYLDKDSLALYSAGIQMAFVIPIIGQSIQLAWTPYVFEQLSGESENTRLGKITVYLCFAVILISLIYAFIYPVIFKLFLPESYHSVLQYYFLFIIAGLFQSLYWLYNPFLLFYERNTFFIYITLFAALISVLLNAFFVKNGLIWVASVFALSWIIQFVCLIMAIKYVKNSKGN